MRLKSISGILFFLLTMMMASGIRAQVPSVEWLAWNTQITVHANTSQLDMAETQTIRVTSGPLHAGERDYSQMVTIQSVYLVMNGGQPQSLAQGSGAGKYQVSNAGSDVVLKYQLPTPANTGDTFSVLINYTVMEPTAGVIDWNVVPGTHGAPVASSTVTINFPDGQAPAADSVRFPQGNGTVTTSGSSIIIKSQGAIPANQPFEIQLPDGSNIGAAGNPADTGANSFLGIALPGIGTILVVLCVGGVLLFLLGGGLLRSLMGGLGGNLLGGILGGISRGGSNGGFFGGGDSSDGGSSNSGGGRGFRDSANQNREVPPVNNDKQSGGGASFS